MQPSCTVVMMLCSSRDEDRWQNLCIICIDSGQRTWLWINKIKLAVYSRKRIAQCT